MRFHIWCVRLASVQHEAPASPWMGEGHGGGKSQSMLAPHPGSTELTEVRPLCRFDKLTAGRGGIGIYMSSVRIPNWHEVLGQPTLKALCNPAQRLCSFSIAFLELFEECQKNVASQRLSGMGTSAVCDG